MCEPRWSPPDWTTARSACTTRCTRWAGTTHQAEPSRPRPDVWEQFTQRRPPSRYRPPKQRVPVDLSADTYARTVSTAGMVSLNLVAYKIDSGHVFEKVLVAVDGTNPGDRIVISTLDGEVVAERAKGFL